MGINYFIISVLVKQTVVLSSAYTQYFKYLVGVWRKECLNTNFFLTILLYAEESVNLKMFLFFIILYVTPYSSDSRYDRVQYECIRCLSAILNNTVGIRAVFECREALPVLARSLDARKPHCALEAAKVRKSVYTNIIKNLLD